MAEVYVQVNRHVRKFLTGRRIAIRPMYAPITVTSEEELLTGPAKLTFEFVKAGDMRGVGHPYVSGMPVGAGDIPRVVFTVAPDEEVQEPFERID